MPTSQWGAETRADREANTADLQKVQQWLDAAIGRVLEEFMQANDLQWQYTVGTSVTPSAWWLSNARTGMSASPLHIQLHSDVIDRSQAPTLVVHIQGAAERFPQNVHTLGHLLHRETKHRVQLQGSRGNTEVWPQ